MKLTRHNGRAGKNGVYNPKHNDRSFDIANSEHIDEERAKQNLYWDCYNGFRNFKNPDKENELSATFEDKSYFTDSQGYLIMPKNLKIGHYRIEEVNAPEGYTINKNYVEIAVDANTACGLVGG